MAKATRKKPPKPPKPPKSPKAERKKAAKKDNEDKPGIDSAFPSEELRYKFLAHQNKLDSIAAEVKQPIIERLRGEYARKMAEGIAKACRNSPGWKREKILRDAAVEEIDGLLDKKSGYCILNLVAEGDLDENGEVTREPYIRLEYNPEEAKKPLKDRLK